MNCNRKRMPPRLCNCLPYLVLDDLPDDPGHLISVQLHHRVLDLDLLDSGRGRHPVLSNLRVETLGGC
jgi:hypothetical protein